jgi:hypothetical protein
VTPHTALLDSNDSYSSFEKPDFCLIRLSRSVFCFLTRDIPNRLRSMRPHKRQGRQQHMNSPDIDSDGSWGSSGSNSVRYDEGRPHPPPPPPPPPPPRAQPNVFPIRGKVNIPAPPTKEPYRVKEYRHLGSWDLHRLHTEVDAIRAFCDSLEQNEDTRSVSLKLDTIESNIYLVYKETIALGHTRKVSDRSEKLFSYRELSDQLFRLYTVATIEKLVPCTVCGDKKRASKFPEFVTKRCAHPVRTCKACIRSWTTAQLGSNGWNRMRCPECPEMLEKGDMKELATEETYDR